MAREIYNGKKQGHAKNSKTAPTASRVTSTANATQSIDVPPPSRSADSSETPVYWTLDGIENKMMSIADESEKKILQQVFHRLRKSLRSKD